MPSADQICSWKTGAWQDAGTVAAFERRHADPSGPDLLKDRLDAAFVARHVVGPDVLETGIGTGRIARPLARGGYNLTGVDVSPAMLRKCKQLCQDVPLRLVQGDVHALPFEDATFDTVLSMDTLIHFPDWQLILTECARVTRPGGRILFDTGALDHDLAYARATGRSETFARVDLASETVIGFAVRVSLEEMLAFAEQHGLHAVAMRPHCTIAGTAAPNRFLAQTPLGGHAWGRLLSWAGEDMRLLAFLLFLEERLFSQLCLSASSRCVVVLERAVDATANAALRERDDRAQKSLAQGLSAQSIAQLGIDGTEFRATLNSHLDHAPNRYALYRILLANVQWGWPIVVTDFVDEPWIGEAHSVLRRGLLDRDFMEFVNGLHCKPGLRERFTYRNIDIGEPWEVDMMAELLDDVVGAFASPLDAPVRGADK